MNSVLVTGGAGFIGSNLVKELLKRKIDVRVIDDLSSGDIGNIPDNVEFLQKDLATISREELYNFMKGVDHVFHLAAKARVQPSIEDPIAFNKANVDSTFIAQVVLVTEIQIMYLPLKQQISIRYHLMPSKSMLVKNIANFLVRFII